MMVMNNNLVCGKILKYRLWCHADKKTKEKVLVDDVFGKTNLPVMPVPRPVPTSYMDVGQQKAELRFLSVTKMLAPGTKLKRPEHQTR